jgi:membrane-associated phospholipid phosphatase
MDLRKFGRALLPVLVLASAVPVARAASAQQPACDARDPVAAALGAVDRFTEEPEAGRWRTWQVGTTDVAVPPPPHMASPESASELAEVHVGTTTRTPDMVAKAQQWGAGAAGALWTDVLLQMIARHSASPSLNPPRISRLIAIFETAMFDALVVTWNAKYCYLRPAPSAVSPLVRPAVDVPPAPSYPSEHAAAAGVAAVLLPAFFPAESASAIDEMASDAATSRVWAGASYPTDVAAGLALGRAVAAPPPWTPGPATRRPASTPGSTPATTTRWAWISAVGSAASQRIAPQATAARPEQIASKKTATDRRAER